MEFQMPFVQRLEARLKRWSAVISARVRLASIGMSQAAACVVGGFDHQRKFGGGRFHRTAVARVGIQRAIDDVGPVNQIGEVGRLNPNFSAAMVAMNLVQDLNVGS